MTWAQLVAAAEEVLAAAPGAGRGLAAGAGSRIAGVGWATVDLERAEGELDGLIAADPATPSLLPWAPLDRDASLGARGSVRAPSDDGVAPALVVLEPDTEGRLAASLARFGEGVLVIYLGVGLPRPGRVLAGPAWGPHVIALDTSDRVPT